MKSSDRIVKVDLNPNLVLVPGRFDSVFIYKGEIVSVPFLGFFI